MAFVKCLELALFVILAEYSAVFGQNLRPYPVFVPSKLENANVPSDLDEIIEKVNKAGSSWTAGKNFDHDVSLEDLRGFVSDINPSDDLKEKTDSPQSCDCGVSAKADPVEFDCRKKWTNCPTISQIQNQGACKSSWAVAAAAVISDRQCIATNGAFKEQMSAEHLLSCCYDCGDGCNGGWARKAFTYYQKHGIVTGGNYNSKQGCQPFSLEPANNFNSPSDWKNEAPKCARECTNKQYSKAMKNDLHFGKGVMTPCCCTATDILQKTGPIVTSMVVYEDLFAYKSGIYRHIWGKKVGYQTVRLIGWGKENGTDYWLAANSWGTSWGEGGFFKIRKGVGECQFEYGYSAPIPKVKKHEE